MKRAKVALMVSALILSGSACALLFVSQRRLDEKRMELSLHEAFACFFQKYDRLPSDSAEILPVMEANELIIPPHWSAAAPAWQVHVKGSDSFSVRVTFRWWLGGKEQFDLKRSEMELATCK